MQPWPEPEQRYLSHKPLGQTSIATGILQSFTVLLGHPEALQTPMEYCPGKPCKLIAVSPRYTGILYSL